MPRARFVLIAATIAGALAAPTTAAASAAPKHPPLSPAQATTELGLDLLRAERTPNAVLSPDSVATALAMAGTGAAGVAQEQIESALHVGSPAALAGLGALQRRIATEQAASAHGDPEAPLLDIADGLFVQSGFPLQAPFLAGLQSSFDATPQLLDFTGAPEAAVNTINRWVSHHTRGLIPRIVGSVSGETRLMLANAIYLKAAWASQFNEGATREEPFHSTFASTPVPFMHREEAFRYASGPGYQALELPYRSSTLSMLIVLPGAGALPAMQRALTAAALQRIVGRLKERSVNLALPRFHIAFAASLNAVLKRLGIRAAFEPRVTNFPRITTGVPLDISRVSHAADIRVDEHGTTAAAATVVEFLEALGPRATPVPFIADHPFLFFVRDTQTGAVLFAGRLADAASAQR